MLSIAPPPTIYLHSGTTDMRKSFDGLSGIIRGTFGGDPADGSLFLFVNKRRDRIKALWWDGDGAQAEAIPPRPRLKKISHMPKRRLRAEWAACMVRA